MNLLDRYDVSPELAWVAAFLSGVVALVGGALAFPQRVYDEVLWRYFIGPVRVDATEYDCLVYDKSSAEILTPESTSCLADANQFVVTEGYTVTSTAGYIAILVFMLAGIYLLLDRFSLRPYRGFFYSLFPFMLFGGVLRTVEDSFIAALDAGATPGLEYPVSALLISPFIYFTVFAIALGAFLLGKFLHGREITDTWTRPIAGAGTAILAVSFVYLVSLSLTTDYVSLYPGILAVTLGVATLCTAGVYVLADRWAPWVHEGTGRMGLVVIWAHAVDGAANVLANDWTQIWHGLDYGAKHPFNQFVMNTTNSLQGGTEILGTYVGEAWPFLLVKLAAPVLILALFDEQFMDESPRFAVLLLGAVVAVGLGPGTRDMVRVALAI
ncbi:Uncharacterized membrane protein [Halovenus aranensis]|uniref:Uncharacterized membrane protein n=1 Tax=Halovenus aranensis TaxID=890420 RepID=A0A1G8TL79_9EURY|nr:DUF63 family protein [Halovenus aranensis]SDJ42336.1 Uncharacterized membrane protein [Halovenus aranensis]